ncbi:hypothetical protein [Pseudolactococcus insecticola]|uniref:Uncharacterized protein n=1 Tax=Pseudolactococcus insecticola TaxID=2709158 RepID=A0A6A0B9A0_9LACT|nr:hypothetical protein [Lactococcus insecticola]GFH40407.1 hypothetical protein Hs20B_08050 [Lactococcus insecticola]
MTEQTRELTNLDPRIREFQDQIRAKYAQENLQAEKGQIDFVGSSLMEIFPIEKMQVGLGLDLKIYNRGVRATTTADLTSLRLFFWKIMIRFCRKYRHDYQRQRSM